MKYNIELKHEDFVLLLDVLKKAQMRTLSVGLQRT